MRKKSQEFDLWNQHSLLMFHWTWLCAITRGTSCETWSIGGCGSRSIAVFHKGTLEGNMPNRFACQQTCKKSCGKASWRLYRVKIFWGVLSLKSNPSHIASATCTAIYEQNPAPFGSYFFPQFQGLKSIPWKMSASLCSSMYEVFIKSSSTATASNFRISKTTEFSTCCAMKQQISTQFLRAATSSGVWLAESCTEGWYIKVTWFLFLYA